MLKVDVATSKFDDGIFSSAKTNQTMTIKDVAQRRFNPAKLPKDMEAGLYATAVYKPTSRTSRTACTSARSRSIPRPARSRSSDTTWSTTSAP